MQGPQGEKNAGINLLANGFDQLCALGYLVDSEGSACAGRDRQGSPEKRANARIIHRITTYYDIASRPVTI